MRHEAKSNEVVVTVGFVVGAKFVGQCGGSSVGSVVVVFEYAMKRVNIFVAVNYL